MRRGSGLGRGGASPEGTAVRAVELRSRLRREERSPGSWLLPWESETLLGWGVASTILMGSLCCHISPSQELVWWGLLFMEGRGAQR